MRTLHKLTPVLTRSATFNYESASCDITWLAKSIPLGRLPTELTVCFRTFCVHAHAST